MNKIVVLGSLSTDFVATTDIRPKVGETVEGNTFFTTFGGKGANQAVAAARLNADVTMLGLVGGDNFGREISDNLKNNGVNIECVKAVTDQSSGAALITIADSDNSIIYVPGANGIVDADYVLKNEDKIKGVDIAVAQHEVGDDAILALARICSKEGIPFVLNPAPFREVSEEIIKMASYIIPNETECELLFPGLSIEEVVAKYPNKMIVTMGSKGVYFNNGEESIMVDTFKVEAVDTTGAGDTFIGGFSTGIANNLSIEDAITLGNLAASQSVTKMGAQGGMPKLEELKMNPCFKEDWKF